MQVITNNRLLWADELRIAAAFAVIITHVVPFGIDINTFAWHISNDLWCLSRFCVPVFIMLSGAFNLRFNNSNKDYNFKDDLQKFLKKSLVLLAALVFWGSINMIYERHFVIKESFNLMFLLKIPAKVFENEPWSHLWYLYLIIPLYLATPLLKLALIRFKKEHFKYYFTLFFILGICIPFYNSIEDFLETYTKIFPNSIYMPFNELSGYLGFYIAGYFFYKYEIKKKHTVFIIAAGLLSLLIEIITAYFYSSVKQTIFPVPVYNFLNPFIVLYSAAIFLLFKNYLGRIKVSAKTARLINHLSICAFGIYLSHWMLVQMLNMALSVFKIKININLAAEIFLKSILIFMLSYLFTIVYKSVFKTMRKIRNL